MSDTRKRTEKQARRARRQSRRSRELVGLAGGNAAAVALTAGSYVGATYQFDSQRPSESLAVPAAERQNSELASPAGAVLIDYFRCTLPDTSENWLALDGWLGERLPRCCGWRGWYDRSAMVLDGGLVASCSNDDAAERQGILVDLPGKACASLGERLFLFVRWCYENGHVTTVHLALDDRTGGVTPGRIKASWNAGEAVSRWQSCTAIEETAKGGKVLGSTVYLGSRSSDAFLRVYDKALERGLTDGQLWTRLELECKGKLAHAIVGAMLQDERKAGLVLLEQLNRRFRITEGHTDGHKRRRRVASWWLAFVGTLERGPGLVLGKVSECITIDKMLAWVERQAGPTMAAILEAAGGDLSLFAGMWERARPRMRPRHKVAIRLYQAALA